MAFIIFYSWQSDLPNSTNRGFIQQALERAAKEIQSDDSIAVEPVIDRDTSGIPGSPDIAATILEKIDMCDVFACDVSVINPGTNIRRTPNPNVLIELGYALKRLGWKRIIMILNTEFGNAEDLPFDLRMKRVITYSAKKEERDRATERKKLQAYLKKALLGIAHYTKKNEKDISTIPNTLTEDNLEWVKHVKDSAHSGFSKTGFKAYVEALAINSVGRRINEPLPKLLDSVRASEIRTFGWPIGVMGLNTENMKPKPMHDGIINSVIIEENDRKTFDFWALRKDGSFYLLKSLFEDMRAEKKIFFNTRIVRTAEMLMFLSRLYKKLGVQGEYDISFELTHSGLNGRYLTATGNRSLIQPYGPATQDMIMTKIATNLSSLDKSISLLVSKLLAPVFELFDFFTLKQEIYDEIVANFKAGKIT